MNEPQPVGTVVPGGVLKLVAIVGASLGGLSTASGLREQGFDGEIVVLEAEAELPPDRPPLSKQVLTGEWTLERAGQPGSANLDDLGLDLRLGRRAVELNVGSRTVILDDRSSVTADAVVLATGSSALRPPIPGIDRPGVHVLRSGSDAVALRAELAAGPHRVLIVGAGFIGLEVAGAATELGLPVTVVEAFATPAARALPPSVGRALAEAAIEAGVDLRTNTAVEALIGPGDHELSGDDAAAPVAGARLSDGTVVAADLVLVAVGAAPVTGWLNDTPGISIDNGVLADATAMAAPGIAAVGDIARWWHRGLGAYVRVEHWDNAIEMGRYVGARLVADDVSGQGPAPEGYAPVPWFWSDQFGAKFQLAGHVHPGDEPVWIDGSPADPRWVGVTHDGTMVKAVMGYNRNPKVMRTRMKMDRPGGLSLAEAVDG